MREGDVSISGWLELAGTGEALGSFYSRPDGGFHSHYLSLAPVVQLGLNEVQTAADLGQPGFSAALKQSASLW